MQSMPPTPPTSAAPPSRGITFRAIAFSIPLMIANAYWITIDEVRWYTLDGTCLPLFITPIFFLFVICLGNFAVKRWKPRLAFDQGELLTIYTMLMMGSVLAAHDLIQNLFGAIAHADRFGTPESGYQTAFFRFLKPMRFLLVSDPIAIKGFYQGGVDWRDPRFVGPFVMPLLWWALFLGVLILVCQSINTLIRRAWTDNEKLAFPIVQLPLAMTNPSDEKQPFWRSKMMWAGFGFAALIDTINGVHYLLPSFPYLDFVKQYNIGQFLTQRPWNVAADTNISMYPFAIGLAYFMPLDLAFSCWFFFAMRKVFQIVGATMGWDSAANVGFPYFEQQASGAWIALGIIIIWSLRNHIAQIWKTAFGRVSGKIGEGDAPATPLEVAAYRRAFVVIALGVVFLSWFASQIGMAAWVAIIFFGLFFVLAVAMTRVRAELGTPHEIYFVNPRTVLVTLFGVNTVGAQSLTCMSVLYWYNRCYRAHPMPNQLEAMKMAEGGRMQQNRLIYLLVGAALLGILFAYIANLHVTFAEGATGRAVGYKRWVGAESFDRLTGWLQTPTKPDYTQIAYVVGGALVVIGLRVMRGTFLWWPFHPAGYALAVSFAMDYFWFAFFISWAIKSLIVRFGGMKAHNAGIPFFLGLIMGDYIVGSFWALFGPLNGLQVYKIFI